MALMMALTSRDRIVLISALMVTQTIGWGTTFSQIGILAEPMSNDLGISRSAILAGATVMYLSAALSAPFAGRMADRSGGFKLLIPGSVALALGLLILSISTGPHGYLSAWVLFGSVLHIGLVTAAYTGLAQVMGKDATRAIGTLTLATGLCSSIFWPLSDFALDYVTWRALCQIYAAVTLFLCAPLHIWIWARFGHLRANDADNDIEDAPAHIIPGKERQGFNLQVAIASCGSMVTVGFGIAVIEIFTELGASRDHAVYAGSLIGVAYVISRGMVTLGANRIAPPQLAAFVYLMLPLSFLPLLICALLGIPLPAWVAVLVAFSFGLPAGVVGVLRSTFPLYLFGSEGYGTILGRQARVTEVASALSPAGLSFLITMSATGAVGALVAASGIALLGTTGIRRLIREKPTESA